MKSCYSFGLVAVLLVFAGSLPPSSSTTTRRFQFNVGFHQYSFSFLQSHHTSKFTIADQRGTLWWHAHLSWQRATVYGAFIIYPRLPYPFSFCFFFNSGEWWNPDVEAVENEMMLSGAGPNSSDAFTINGLPGPLYPCSYQGRTKILILLLA